MTQNRDQDWAFFFRYRVWTTDEGFVGFVWYPAKSSTLSVYGQTKKKRKQSKRLTHQNLTDLSFLCDSQFVWDSKMII